MPNFQTYNVIPTLPAALEPLREMSFNVWWTWEPSARRLFQDTVEHVIIPGLELHGIPAGRAWSSRHLARDAAA